MHTSTFMCIASVRGTSEYYNLKLKFNVENVYTRSII